MVADELFLGRYRTRRQIGRGALGTVVEARDERLNLPVAIKRMHRALASDAAAVARFEREATVAQQLGGPHVVQILDEGLSEGIPFFVMELLDGTPLSAFLAARLPAPVAAEVIARACVGLDAAHRRGIVHGNVRPSTIFVARTDQGPQIKLVDFGLERGDFEPRSERVSERDVGDSWSDVRALGEVLVDVVDPNTTTAGLEAVLARCRSTDPKERFRSASGLRDALQPFARSAELARFPFFTRLAPALRDSGDEDTATHSGRTARANLIVVVLVSLVAAAVLVVIIATGR